MGLSKYNCWSDLYLDGLAPDDYRDASKRFWSACSGKTWIMDT